MVNRNIVSLHWSGNTGSGVASDKEQCFQLTLGLVAPRQMGIVIMNSVAGFHWECLVSSDIGTSVAAIGNTVASSHLIWHWCGSEEGKRGWLYWSCDTMTGSASFKEKLILITVEDTL